MQHCFVIKKSKSSPVRHTITHRLTSVVINDVPCSEITFSSRIILDGRTWSVDQLVGEGKNLKKDNKELQRQRTEIEELFNMHKYRQNFNRYSYINDVKKEVFKIIKRGTGVDDESAKICEPISRYVEKKQGKLCLRRRKLYDLVRREFQMYLGKIYGQKDVEIQVIQARDWLRFENWLLVPGKRGQNTGNTMLKVLDSVVNDAVRVGIVDRNPFAAHQIRSVETSRVALTEDEIQRIWEIPKEHLSERENLSRWVALWQRYIGVAYSDLIKLNTSNLSYLGSHLVLKLRRNKTDVPTTIPLCAEAIHILRMFNTEEQLQQVERKLLFVPSYNKYNGEDLKVIQRKANIKTNLSSHILRHTFACSCLDAGGTAETLMKMMGHKKLATTMLYGKISDNRVLNEACMVMSRFKTNLTIAPDRIPISEAYRLKSKPKKVSGML